MLPVCLRGLPHGTLLAVMNRMPDDASPPRAINWPHAPPHRLSASVSYFITAATWQKACLFHDTPRLDLLHHALLAHERAFGWQLEAWAVVSNHYHFIARPAQGPAAKADLGVMIKALHERTTRELNELDAQPGRRVWHNYWDTCLTFDASHRARPNYVMQHPVKHALVKDAKDYRWCYAAWFERVNTGAWLQTIHRFKTDKLKIEDDYEV